MINEQDIRLFVRIFLLLLFFNLVAQMQLTEPIRGITIVLGVMWFLHSLRELKMFKKE